MANLFLGFPVARAKIADMIASDAPPAKHKTQHEDDGTDEIDCTGLEGAGGGLPWEDFQWFTLFQALDNFTTSTGGDGTVTLSLGWLKVASGTTAGSTAEIYRTDSQPFPTLTWDKERRCQVQVRLYSITDEIGTLYILCGRHGTANRHIGFMVEDGVLKGVVCNGTTVTKTTLETLASAAYTKWRKLEVKHFPASKVEFWVDGVKVGEQTDTDLIPSGGGGATGIMELRAQNDAKTGTVEVWVTDWKVWQAA